MAPVSKFENDHPAVSLLLVKPAPSDPKSNTGDQTSRAAMMQMIYQLLLLVGENTSKIQQLNAKSQMDQAQIAKDVSKITEEKTAEVVKVVSKLIQEMDEAKSLGVFGEVMKWVGVGIAVLAGALLVETGVGLAMLVAAIAIAVVPIPGCGGKSVFDLVSGAIGKKLAETKLGKTWGGITAQIICIVAITAVSMGAEGVASGSSKAATTAAQDTADAEAQAAAKIAREAAEAALQATTKAAETAPGPAQEAAQAAAKAAQKTADSAAKTAKEAALKASKVAKGATWTDFMPARTTATTQVTLQELFSSSVLQQITQEIVDKVDPHHKFPWLQAAMIFAMQLAIMGGALALTPASTGSSFVGNTSSKYFPRLTQALSDSIAIRMSVATFVFFTELLSLSANAATAQSEIDQGNTNDKLAPLQANLSFYEGFMQVMSQMTNFVQQTFKASMNTSETINKIDFSRDMGACVAAQHYLA